jgi:hypothetical protein
MLVYLPGIALQHSASILTLANGSESSCSGIGVVAMRFPASRRFRFSCLLDSRGHLPQHFGVLHLWAGG